jgi:Tol biopolymer transport system component
MRATTIALALTLGLLTRATAEDPPDTLLTVPMRDLWGSGANPPSASVSGDGRFVAFASYARLTPADTNTTADIYVLDRLSGGVTLESHPESATLVGDTTHPRLSADGRYLVFESAVALDDSVRTGVDVVLRDRARDTTTRISRSRSGGFASGTSRQPAISDDGRIVVFASSATDLVAGPDENGVADDVYMLETTTGTVRRVSVDSNGLQRARGASMAPDVSGDGRYVVFTSTADLRLRSGDRPLPDSAGSCGAADCLRTPLVYVRDTQLGVTSLVSVDARGDPLLAGSRDAAISGDGRYVAFASEATNLARRDHNHTCDVFLRDLRTRSTVLVSRNADGEAANGSSNKPAVSGDGRFVAFQSEASDLICLRRCPPSVEDINLLSDVFLFDRVTGRLSLISAGPSGRWIEESVTPRLDARGHIVAFASRHPIDEHDVRHDFDLFVRVPHSDLPFPPP